MAETLFGYTIDEDDGTLVVTVRGVLAEDAIRQLRERVERGETWPVTALLSPVVPIGRLLSAPVRVQSEPVATKWSSVDEEALNQQVDQTLAAFGQQIQEFTAALAALEAEQAPPPAQSKPAKAERTPSKPARESQASREQE